MLDPDENQPNRRRNNQQAAAAARVSVDEEVSVALSQFDTENKETTTVPTPKNSRENSPTFQTPTQHRESNSSEDSVVRELTANMSRREQIELLSEKYPRELEDLEDEEIEESMSEERKIKILRHRQHYAKEKEWRQCMKVLTIHQKEQDKPTFNGDKDKKPESHLLLVEDWKEKQGFTNSQMMRKFRETLEGSARLWYQELDLSEMTWEKMQQEFIREYTKEGKSNFQIKLDQSHLRFDPDKDKIKDFIRDVKNTGKILKQSEEEIKQTIAEAVPPEMYYVASACQNLDKLCEFLINTYNSRRAKEQREKAKTTSATSSPFMTMQTSVETKPQPLLEARQEPRERSPHPPPKPKPFKPWITKSGRGRPSYSQPPRRYDNRNWNSNRGRSFSRPRYYNRGPSRRPSFRSYGRQRSYDSYDRNYRRQERSPRSWSRERRYESRSPTPRRDDRREERREERREDRRDERRRESFRSMSSDRYNPRTTRRFISPKPPRASYRDSDNARQQRIDRTRCFRCNEPGHWARECPLVPTLRQRSYSQPREPRSVSFRFQESEYEDDYELETDEDQNQEN